jgi:hypothetical protein
MVAVRRDAPSWLVGDSPSGAEASSGPPNTCRSTGRGVEKATGIPPAGTPGNRGSPHSYVIPSLLEATAPPVREPVHSLHRAIQSPTVTDEFDDPEPRPLYGRRSIAVGVALVVAATALGAVFGLLAPGTMSTETVTVFEITFVLSPATTAAYAGVGVTTFLVTLALVFRTITRLEE